MRADLKAVVIADDLTGAADTGVQFTAVGSPVYLMPTETLSLDRPWMAAAAGISVYTGSRQVSPQVAAQRLRPVARALADLRPEWVYKKIDSCLRGNLGAETDVLLDALGLDAALVAPALPGQGRATIGGIHRVHGRPVAETEFARDPLAPVASSAITEILAGQSRYPIGRIDVGEYGDPDRLTGALERERRHGCRLIVCDAAEQAHLDQVATLVVRSAGRLLPVGSAGLAAALVENLPAGVGVRPSSDRVVDPPVTPGPQRLLMVVGTCSQVTRAQLDALLERYPGMRCELAPEWLVEVPVRDRRRWVSDLLDAWSGGILALAFRPLFPGGPMVTHEQAVAGVAGLAGLAAELVRDGRADSQLLSGGETADAFLRASGGEAIRLQGELLPGLVLGRWLGGVADGLSVVTKAGAFGHEQTLVALYERLCAGAES